MIALAFSLLIFFVVLYIVYLIVSFIITSMGLPAVARQILYLFLGLIALIYLASLFGVGPGLDLPRA